MENGNQILCHIPTFGAVEETELSVKFFILNEFENIFKIILFLKGGRKQIERKKKLNRRRK